MPTIGHRSRRDAARVAAVFACVISVTLAAQMRAHAKEPGLWAGLFLQTARYALEHFPEKWEPVFRKKMRPIMEN